MAKADNNNFKKIIHCKDLYSSSGPAMPSMHIECLKIGKRSFGYSNNPENVLNWEKQYEICLKDKEKCIHSNSDRSCKNCRFSVDYGYSVGYIFCEKPGRRKKEVRKTDYCTNYEYKAQQETYTYRGLV